MLDRLAGPDPPRLVVRRPAPDAGGAGAPTVHLAPRPGTNVALMNALLHELIAQRLGRPGLRRGAHRRLRRAGERGRDVHAGAGRRDLRRAGATIREAARLLGTARAAAVHGAAGLLPVAPGDRRGRAGQQPAPAARHARPAGLRRAADERPAHRAEHPRVRRRRRPAGLPQLGQRRARRGAGARSGTSSRCRSRTTAPPTHAMQIFRYAEQGSIRFLWISGDQPGGVAAGAARGSASILAQERLFLVVQDIFLTETAAARRRRAARRDVGREDRHVHQRRPHGAPVREGGRPAGRGAPGPRHLPRLRPPDGLPRQGRRAAGRRGATPRAAFEALEGVQPRPALRLHAASPTRSCAAAAASSGRAPTRHPTAPSGSTPTARSGPTPDDCESYGRDLVTGAPVDEPTSTGR